MIITLKGLERQAKRTEKKIQQESDKLKYVNIKNNQKFIKNIRKMIERGCSKENIMVKTKISSKKLDKYLAKYNASNIDQKIQTQ